MDEQCLEFYGKIFGFPTKLLVVSEADVRLHFQKLSLITGVEEDELVGGGDRDND